MIKIYAIVGYCIIACPVKIQNRILNATVYVVVSAKNSFASCVAAKFSRQSEQVNEESGARVVSY
jgi:hypothetical protein